LNRFRKEFIAPNHHLCYFCFLGAEDNPYDQTDVFNINGALFSSVCSFSFTYLFLVVFAFPRMQIVLRREFYDGLYYLITAFLAESIAGLPFLLVMPGLFGKFITF
jgi:hypothetical protein